MALPEPPQGREPPRDRLARLESEVGAREAALLCAELLSAEDPTDHPVMLRWLGDRSGQAILDGSPSWKPYWGNVWGARGLLYVWDDDATPDVLAGLRHDAWRVAEMCLKVSARRDLPAGDEAVRLAHEELPRVRAAAMRALAAAGDVEHVAAVEAALDDPEEEVRRAAQRALDDLRTRLDLA